MFSDENINFNDNDKNVERAQLLEKEKKANEERERLVEEEKKANEELKLINEKREKEFEKEEKELNEKKKEIEVNKSKTSELKGIQTKADEGGFFSSIFSKIVDFFTWMTKLFTSPRDFLEDIKEFVATSSKSKTKTKEPKSSINTVKKDQKIKEEIKDEKPINNMYTSKEKNIQHVPNSNVQRIQ